MTQGKEFNCSEGCRNSYNCKRLFAERVQASYEKSPPVGEVDRNLDPENYPNCALVQQDDNE